MATLPLAAATPGWEREGFTCCASELLANSSGVQHAIAEKLGLDWEA